MRPELINFFSTVQTKLAQLCALECAHFTKCTIKNTHLDCNLTFNERVTSLIHASYVCVATATAALLYSPQSPPLWLEFPTLFQKINKKASSTCRCQPLASPWSSVHPLHVPMCSLGPACCQHELARG